MHPLAKTNTAAGQRFGVVRLQEEPCWLAGLPAYPEGSNAVVAPQGRPASVALIDLRSVLSPQLNTFTDATPRPYPSVQ